LEQVHSFTPQRSVAIRTTAAAGSAGQRRGKSNAVLSWHLTGAHHGQTDESCVATLGDEVVAFMDVSVYCGAPRINFIQVEPPYRRAGIASRMVVELQRRYPETEIGWGYMTDSGRELRRSIPHRDVINLFAVERQRDMERLLKIERAIQADYERRAELQSISPERVFTDQMRRICDLWNGVRDRIDDLRRDLEDVRPVRRLVVLEPVTPEVNVDRPLNRPYGA